MKRFLLSNQELISFYLLIAFLISLPVKENFNSLSMILLSVFAFLLILFKQKINSSLLKKFIPLFVFYGVLLISVIYSSDTANAMKMVSRWLPFILLPFVFSIINLPAKRYHQLMKLFIYWMAMLCVYSHVVILIKLYNNNDVLYNIFNSHYSYLSLSKGTIGLHSTYYAYFIIVAVVFLVNFLFTEKRRSMQIGYFLLLAYFSFFVFHLSARLPIAVLFVFYNLALLYYFTKQKQILKGVLFLVLLYFISSLVIYNVRITRYRFQHLFGLRILMVHIMKMVEIKFYNGNRHLPETIMPSSETAQEMLMKVFLILMKHTIYISIPKENTMRTTSLSRPM